MRYLAVFIALCAIAFCSNESYAQGKITRNKQESVSHRSTTKKAVSKNKESKKVESPKPASNKAESPKPESNNVESPKPENNKTEINKVEFKREGTYGYLNGHEWIDLGLPSGTKWATMNIGAYSSTGQGDYFAWGEIVTPPNKDYSRNHCKLYGRKTVNISGSNYDVAKAKWGIGWVLPEKKDVIELVKFCSVERTKVSNVDGFKITGPNRNSIFLPYTGVYWGTLAIKKGSSCGYWIGTEYDKNKGYLFQVVSTNTDDKNAGHAVRAITRTK